MGISLDFITHRGHYVLMTAEGRSVKMPSLFPDLSGDRPEWLRQVPDENVPVLDVSAFFPETGIETSLPILFGSSSVSISEREIEFGADILGTAFFMLSRFEEVSLSVRDRFDRFPAIASVAHKAGFLERPIIDEYAALLKVAFRRLWPQMEPKRPDGRVRVSCDVDQPFDRVGTSGKALLRSLAGDLTRRRDPLLALRRSRNFVAHRHGDLRFDPYYTFDWYMNACERHGRRAAFYFISDHSGGAIDGTYKIDEPRILDLMRKLDARGHEVGMHGSFNTFRDPVQIQREKNRLGAAAHKAGVTESIKGNRQHYLRWDSFETPDHLDAAGFQYDTTGSFADRPGFRFGTAHSFPMWSWSTQAPLQLRQMPLVVMEASIMAKGYLGLGRTEAALTKMLEMKRRALRFGGDFSLLWHNSELLTPRDREMFATAIA